MPISSTLVTRFFQLVTNKRFAEAERELQRLKRKTQKTEWNRGYYKALYGILIARKANGDQYAFVSNLDLEDLDLIESYREEFLKHVKNRLHDEYDRGFFSAWADYMRVILKIQSKKAVETSDPVEEASRPKQTDISQYVRVETEVGAGGSRTRCKTTPRKQSKRQSKRRSPS